MKYIINSSTIVELLLPEDAQIINGTTEYGFAASDYFSHSQAYYLAMAIKDQSGSQIGFIEEVDKSAWSVVPHSEDNIALTSAASRINIGNQLRGYDLAIDLSAALSTLQLNAGTYTIVARLLKHTLGDYSTNKTYITEISNSRKEVRIRPLSPKCSNLEWEQLDLISDSEKTLHYTIEYGGGQYALISNWIRDIYYPNDCLGSYIVKAYGTLPTAQQQKSLCWISQIAANPIQINVTFVNDSLAAEGDYAAVLAGPNYFINSTGAGSRSEFTSADQIFNTATDNVYNHAVGSYVSASVWSDIRSRDYSEFANFVHFGSAYKRVDNFFNKMAVLEDYERQIAALNANTASVYAGSDIALLNARKTDVIQQFDGYEYNLYYKSSSGYTDSYGDHLAYTYPKYGSNPSWSFFSTSSPQAMRWYDTQSNAAQAYDDANIHSLVNTIPAFIGNDEHNADYITFVQMVGHMFDNIRMQASNIGKISQRDINLDFSETLLLDIAQALGFDLYSEYARMSSIYSYTMGRNNNGMAATSSIADVYPISTHAMATEVGQRLLANLPLLYQSKGTRNAIRSLLNCYGVPESILPLQEFSTQKQSGSYSNAQLPNKAYSFLDYGLQFHSNVNTYVSCSWKDNGQAATCIEAYFRLPLSGVYPASQSFLTLLDPSNAEQLSVSVYKTSSQLGRIHVYTNNSSDCAESDELPLFNGNRWYIKLWNDHSGSGGAKTIHANLISYNQNKVQYDSMLTNTFTHCYWNSGSIFYVGHTGSGCQGFDGVLHGLKLSLTGSSNPTVVRYNRASNPYAIDESAARLTNNLMACYNFQFAGDIPPKTIASLPNYAPGKNGHNIAQLRNFSTVTTFPYNFYLPENNDWLVGYTPSLGTFVDSHRIKIDAVQTAPTVYVDKSINQRGECISAIPDPKLSLAFSISEAINRQIINYFGTSVYTAYSTASVGSSFDDLIGDPRDAYSDEYNNLLLMQKEFWKQVPSSNNYNKFVRTVSQYDNGLFKTVSHITPAKSKLSTGITIEPHLLNRSKSPILRPLQADKTDLETAYDISSDITYNAQYSPLINEVNISSSQDACAQIYGYNTQCTLDGTLLPQATAALQSYYNMSSSALSLSMIAGTSFPSGSSVSGSVPRAAIRDVMPYIASSIFLSSASKNFYEKSGSVDIAYTIFDPVTNIYDNYEASEINNVDGYSPVINFPAYTKELVVSDSDSVDGWMTSKKITTAKSKNATK